MGAVILLLLLHTFLIFTATNVFFGAILNEYEAPLWFMGDTNPVALEGGSAACQYDGATRG